jgi:hypothetical protein
MCLAIYQPAGIEIPEGHLLEGFKNNPHGAGFMYFDEKNNVCSYKSMHFDSFIDEYEKAWAEHGRYSPFAIHFRWATHGTQDINNVHPFYMNKNVCVMHNGIIDCIIQDKKMSDTAAFVQDYLGNLPRNFQDNEFLFDMVEQYTSGSKLIMFTSDPQAQYAGYIFNENAGHWAEKVWYSNASYSCAKPRSFVNYKSAELSAKTFEDQSIESFDACVMCGEESVLDEICYNCESCQRCFMTEEECACGDAIQLHAMTNEQFMKYYAE